MTLKQVISQLQYITQGPPRERGGFHPQTVATAKAALYQLKKIHQERKALQIIQRFCRDDCTIKAVIK